MEQIIEYVMRGNTTQLSDHAFVAELETWIRFNVGEAVTKKDGLFAAAVGNPTLPRWLGSALMPWFITPASENEKYAMQVRSSSGVAVFVSAADGKTHWVEAGCCYERFALQATALGIRDAMLNQPVEVVTLRPHFAPSIGGDRRAAGPDRAIRLRTGNPAIIAAPGGIRTRLKPRWRTAAAQVGVRPLPRTAHPRLR